MSKFIFNNTTINATTMQVGDIYNYSTPQDFIVGNSNINFTETEKELVRIIYQNTQSEEERKEILSSLIAINSGEGSVEEKKKSIINFKPLIKKLGTFGSQVTLKIVEKCLTDYATQYGITDIIQKLF